MKQRLIDANALIQDLRSAKYLCYDNNSISRIGNHEIDRCISFVEDAPTINPDRKFIEIRATYTPDELVAYPEYKGKPYYSIVYEENGEQFCGFGTYKIEVLSRYLRDYFIIGEEDTTDEEETY